MRLTSAAILATALTGLLPASQRPDLVETGVSVAQRTVRAGSSLRVTDAARNRGGLAAPRSATGYYLSRDRARGRGDVRLGRRAIGSLRPRVTVRRSVTVFVPASVAPGSYRVLACADDLHWIRESNERNNCGATARGVEVIRPPGPDRSPPTFAGLEKATTCIPGPVGEGRSSVYRLAWAAAIDDVTPSSRVVYLVYQATAPGGEDFSAPTYTTPPGATSFATPSLPASRSYYFVVRARDEAGNRDSNRVERAGVNLCV